MDDPEVLEVSPEDYERLQVRISHTFYDLRASLDSIGVLKAVSCSSIAAWHRAGQVKPKTAGAEGSSTSTT